MKKTNCILLIFLFVIKFDFGFSQNSKLVNDRIAEIKIWYGEIQSIGLKNCNEKTTKRLDSFDGETNKIEFDQTIKKCKLNSIYEVCQGFFLGYEWGSEIYIYKKSNKVFFIYCKYGGEGYLTERRYYFDDNGRLIKELEKITDAQSKSEKSDIKENLRKSIDEIFSTDKDFNSVLKFSF